MSEGINVASTRLVECKINGLELTGYEIGYANMQFELGGGMAYCDLTIVTGREEVITNCLLEMSKIELTLGIPDENGLPVVQKRGTFFLAKANPSHDLANDTSIIKVKGITYAHKFLSTPKIWSTETKETTTKFINRISGIGSGYGELQLEIKDDLINRTNDKQYWIQYNTTGMEALNVVLLRSLVTPKSGRNEWMYSYCIDFTNDGKPIIYLYDVKLRTQTFGPKILRSTNKPARFTYGNEPESIPYESSVLDMKGADYSAMYWKRNAFAFDMEEGTHWSRTVSQPKLFSDSVEYSDPKEVDGTNIPSEMMIFKSDARLNHQLYNTNMYSKYYIDQKVEITAMLLALRKINLKLTFSRKMIDIMPGEICYANYRISDKSGHDKPIDRLSGNYMVTKTIYEYDKSSVNTYLVVSRDSFVVPR